MRIEFQYSFNEWLEYRRIDVGRVNLAFLKIAEGSLITLSLLCGLSVIVVSLRLLNLPIATARQFPVWLPILFLIPIATIQIFLSTVPRYLLRKVVKQEWQNQMANLEYEFEATEKGLDANSAKTPWNEITSVFQTKRLLIFCKTSQNLLVIPKRAFTSKEQLDKFLELAYQKTVSERDEDAKGESGAQ